MLSEGTSPMSPLTPQFLILVRETELPFYLRSAWKIKPVWLSDSCCYFFFKVIVETVFESFCLQVTNSLKAKKKKVGEKKLFRGPGIWWVEKKYLQRQPS